MVGSIGRALFGGSEQSSSQFSRPTDVTPPELAALRGPFADTLKRLFGAQEGDPLAGVPKFQGPLAAPIGANEEAILSRLMQEGDARRNLLEQTQAGAFLPGQGQSNPFLEAMIEAAQRPTLQGLEETLSRTLPGRFTQGGQFVQPEGSSAFDRAAAIATRGVAQEMGDIATQLSGQAFESERGRQQQAIQLGQEEVRTTVQNLQAQALPRLIEDLGVERGLQEFQNRIQAVLQALSVATGAPLVKTGQESQGESSGTSQGGIVPGLSSAFGAAFPGGV